MKEILGCKGQTEGQFVFCIDCKYQNSNIDCGQFIASSNAELKVSIDNTSKNLLHAAGGF